MENSGSQDVGVSPEDPTFCLSHLIFPFLVFELLVVFSPTRLFMEILNSVTDCDEIQFMEDGSWCPMKPKKESQEVCQPSAYNGMEGTDASSREDCPNDCHDTFSFKAEAF